LSVFFVAPSHTQQLPCAGGAEAKVASVVTAVTYSATQSDRCAWEIERREAFRPMLKLIRLLPRLRPAGRRAVFVYFPRSWRVSTKGLSTPQGEHQRTASRRQPQ